MSRELQREAAVPEPGQYFTADDLAALYKMRDDLSEMVAVAKKAIDERWSKALHTEVRARRPPPPKTGRPQRGALHDDVPILLRFTKAVAMRPLDKRRAPEPSVYTPEEVARLREALASARAWAEQLEQEVLLLANSVPAEKNKEG